MGRNRKKKARAKTRAAAASTDGGAASGTRFTPLEAKAAGDSAFAAGSFAAAVTAYSQAVDGLSAVPLASATATAAVGGTTRGEAGSAEAVEPGRKVEEGEHGGSSVADTEQLLKAVLCNRAAARLRLGNAVSDVWDTSLALHVRCMGMSVIIACVGNWVCGATTGVCSKPRMPWPMQSGLPRLTPPGQRCDRNAPHGCFMWIYKKCFLCVCVAIVRPDGLSAFSCVAFPSLSYVKQLPSWRWVVSQRRARH